MPGTILSGAGGRWPTAIRGLAPELGQHTEEVLLETGYSWEEIESLRTGGAIGPKNADGR